MTFLLVTFSWLCRGPPCGFSVAFWPSCWANFTRTHPSWKSLLIGSFLGSAAQKPGFRQRGLANNVSPFFPENETEKTEENGKKRKKTEKKQGKNGTNRKKRKKTKKIGSDTVPATPFAKPRKNRIANPSGHGGRKRARNHSAAEIAENLSRLIFNL